ncbi:MAG: peptidase dimerization domain protein [Flammeovirgaceae bacterium TMED32]|mgnify:FL=1|nr:MAG: peptidase dimerization domain protein [Flammeovirgaceae bacterium TMED32]|tara:strand:- start:978 stop:2351 length:1374 start_codon:yes stop_codon:yes gene_type:complete
MTTLEYLNGHKDKFLNELLDLLRIPSVSADKKFDGDVKNAAMFVKDQLIAAGVDYAELCETKGQPIVYAEKIIDPTFPTVLVYGHYDVQPADPYELWDHPPFEPIVKNDRIYARGACDDKGQMYMHVKAFEAMMETNTLTCNVKFMIEGEEEVGSDNLEAFIKEEKQKLSADVILISDTSIINNDTPSITVGLRGLSYIEVEVTGPNKDLHSGVYGGAVANPINILSKLIADMQDEEGRITLPGFYDDVLEYSEAQRAEMAKAPFDLDHYKKELNIEEIKGEKGFSTIERVGIRPCLDVNGIWGGYTGPGSKTVLPAKAFAKISTRLVSNQNSDKITQMIIKYFEENAPKSVKVKVTPHHGGTPAVVSTHSNGYQAASKAFAQSWGKTPIPTMEGGSIPIVALFIQELKIEPILMGFGLDSDDIHSPNESYGLFNYYKGIETIAYFYHHFSQVSKNN